jgi:hypothetical protein
MATYAPPASSSGQSLDPEAEFNTANYTSNLTAPIITLGQCDSRYLKKSGGIITGALTVASEVVIQGNVSMNAVATKNIVADGLIVANGLRFNSNLPPNEGQLGYSQVASIGVPTTLSGIITFASLSIPVGTYILYGQVGLLCTVAGSSPMSSFAISIGNKNSQLSSPNQTSMLNITMSASTNLTQNITAIITNYTGSPVVYYLLAQIVFATGSYSTTTKNNLTQFSYVRIA